MAIKYKRLLAFDQAVEPRGNLGKRDVDGARDNPARDFVVGVQRWFWRVTAYALLLTTDEYPPFRLSP